MSMFRNCTKVIRHTGHGLRRSLITKVMGYVGHGLPAVRWVH